MPARVIRGEIVSSDSLARVSVEAELVFMKLLLVVDDFGRGDARIPLLRSMLFPMRPDFDESRLVACLDELSGGDDPPIVFYEVGGRPFLHLPKWEIHRGKARRAASSRLPDPTESTPGDPRGSAGIRSGGSIGVGIGSGVGEGVSSPPSADSPVIENPPEVPIETPHETPPCPDPPDPKPSKATKRKTAVPDVLSESDQARVAAWAAKRSPPITPEQLEYGWEVYRAKARSNGYRYVDQAQAFMNAMGATGEAWALKGFGATAPPGESAAEAKSRRIKENAREALRRHQARKAGSTDQPPLIAIQGSGQ